MALTKVTKTGITDNAIDGDKIEDGTVVAADIAPGTISSDKIATGTIANNKLANSSVTINNSAVSLGGSIELATGTDWQAVTVADGSTTLNAEAGKGYFLDTNAGVIEVFLPSSPARGDKVILADYSGTFATNQIIINTGGELLDSTAGNDFKVTTNNSIVELVYVDSAKGWLVKLNQAAGTTPDSALTGGNVYDTDQNYILATGGTVTESGDYKIHTFTGDGCFVVSTLGSGVPCAVASTVDYLVVAGGGGGGTNRGGGGGAGGFRESKDSTLNSPHTASPLAATTGLTISAITYPVTVGGGGGNNSSFSTITSTGGGEGGGSPEPGYPGGSAGGGGHSPVGKPGGTGNTPPVSPPQGNSGGTGQGPAPGNGGGGGGATASGGNAPGGGVAGNGGAGATTSISGSPTTYAGGGGGGSYLLGGTSTVSSGGAGGGGSGGTGTNSAVNATAGSANTGGGGGGGSSPGSNAAGGKGIVIIRYKFQ